MNEGRFESFEKPMPFKIGDYVTITDKLAGVRIGDNFRQGEMYVVVFVDEVNSEAWVGPHDMTPEEVETFSLETQRSAHYTPDNFMPFNFNELEKVTRH